VPFLRDLVGVLLLATGCTGVLEDLAPANRVAPGDESVPAVTSRAVRMTHGQWENTVQDLLRLDEPTG
jgi:hypothetical protein